MGTRRKLWGAAGDAADVNALLFLFFRLETAAAVIAAVLIGGLGYQWLGFVGAVLGAIVGAVAGFFGVLIMRVLG